MQEQQETGNCTFQDCAAKVRLPHRLCPMHWIMRFDRVIIRCPACQTYRPIDEENCETCRRGKRRPATPPAKRQN